MDNTKIYDKIQEVIDSPIKNFTKEEARKILREYNIIDDNGEITEPFKSIIVKKEEIAPMYKETNCGSISISEVCEIIVRNTQKRPPLNGDYVYVSFDGRSKIKFRFMKGSWTAILMED